MPRIHVLPPALASQIAAGEVVERPASALKELIENALDAGARRCDIALEGGGITRLSVRDDGCGMSPEDARLALQRHATSKLKSFEDLSSVSSYGFRGEALPSIASVSRLTLRTRAAEQGTGVELVVEGGAEPQNSEVGMAVGTHIEVRDLFFNVPARRKFLRSSATESGHAIDVVENAALACPDVTFTVERDGRKAREWLRAQSRLERVTASFPDEEFTQCQGERGPLLFEAYLSRPERARNGAAGLKLFCNNRPIRDRAVLTTIAQAFGGVLERGRYPRGVVYLDLPPELVDVNVHPQKAEVRFADARAVTDAVYQLASTHLARAFTLPQRTSGASGRYPNAGAEHQRGALLSRNEPAENSPAGASGEALTDGDAVTVRTTSAEHAVLAAQVATVTRQEQSQLPLRARDVSEPLFPRSSSAITERVEAVGTEPSAGSGRRENGVVWSRLRFIAQVRATYLLCEGDDGLYVIDQHAAAERVTFHRLREQYAAAKLTSQALLFPVTLQVRPEQSELLEKKLSEIQRLGFEVRLHSETTVSLHAIPKLLQRGSPERLLLDLLVELSRSGRAFSDALDTVLSTMACHGSVRSGDMLSSQEASALLRELDKVDFAGHCPHGRPIVAAMSFSELERRVGRR